MHFRRQWQRVVNLFPDVFLLVESMEKQSNSCSECKTSELHLHISTLESSEKKFFDISKLNPICAVNLQCSGRNRGAIRGEN